MFFSWLPWLPWLLWLLTSLMLHWLSWLLLLLTSLRLFRLSFGCSGVDVYIIHGFPWLPGSLGCPGCLFNFVTCHLSLIIIDSIKKVLFCPGRFSLFICPILGNIKRDLFVDLWFRKCKYIYWSNRSRYLFHEKKNCRLTITFMQEHGFGFLDGFEHGRDINTGMEVAPFCRSTSSALAFRFQIFQMAPTFGRFYRRLFFLTIWPIFSLYQ